MTCVICNYHDTWFEINIFCYNTSSGVMPIGVCVDREGCVWTERSVGRQRRDISSPGSSQKKVGEQ